MVIVNNNLENRDFRSFIDTVLSWKLEDALSAKVKLIEDDDFYCPMAFIDEYSVNILNYCLTDKTVEEVGRSCVDASKEACYKFGENRVRLLEHLGVLSVDKDTRPSLVRTTNLGRALLSLSNKDATRVMVRLTISIPIVHSVLTSNDSNNIVLSNFFPQDYKKSTIRRRSSSLIHIIGDIEKEFDCYGYLCHISLNNTRHPDSTDSNSINNQASNSNHGGELVEDDDEDESSVNARAIYDSHDITGIISSFIHDFYKLDVYSKIKPMFETLLNIIEDPTSDFIVQTIAHIPLGYFVKYCSLNVESLKECECVCLFALQRIYDLDMDLVVCNLSPDYSLKDYYFQRDSFEVRYREQLHLVKYRSGINEFYDKSRKDRSSEKYIQYLNQLYVSEANLYYRISLGGNQFLDEENYIHSLRILFQSRLYYPENGIDSIFKPLLENYSVHLNSVRSTVMEYIFGLIDNCSQYVHLTPYLDGSSDFWQDRVNELLMLSYILSPHRKVVSRDVDFRFVVAQSLYDKVMLLNDDDIAEEASRLFKKEIMGLTDEEQMEILSRVNSILIAEYLNSDLPFDVFIQDDVVSITRMCLTMDRKSGRKAKYKSSPGITSSLEVSEKTKIDEIRNYRNHTDSVKSRLNRYKNRVKYGYEDE